MSIANLKPYPVTKDSSVRWLGEVPKHWDIFQLRHVLRRRTARNRPDLPLLSIVREEGVILRDRTTEDENHNYIPDDLSNYRVVHAGEFAVNKMKAWQGSYGVSNHDGIVSPAYFVFEVSRVETDFFHTAIRSRAYVPAFARASDGVRIGQWDLAESRMRQIRFLLPPPVEQEAIVRFLDHADQRIRRYIRAKQKLIALLEEHKQTVIRQAVTGQIDILTNQPYTAYKPSGVAWLGNVPVHWEVAALRHRYSQRLGKMLDSKRITGNHSLPYLRNTDVQWDQINIEDLPTMDIRPDQYDRYTVQQGDLLVCEGGEVGRCALWSGGLTRCGFQKALHRLRPRNASRDVPRFMYYTLRTAVAGNAFKDGHLSTIAHLTGDKLRAHRFPFPPIAEQESLASFLDAVSKQADRTISHTRREIELMREYRTRLVADLVTGKLDAREAAAALPEVDSLADENDLDDTMGEISQPAFNRKEEGAHLED